MQTLVQSSLKALRIQKQRHLYRTKGTLLPEILKMALRKMDFKVYEEEEVIVKTLPSPLSLDFF